MCWVVEYSEAIHIVILSLGLVGGGYGLYLATVRSRIADRNLLRERYQMGMQLFSLNPERYTARVAGASILSDILLDSNSTEYDKSILRAFEARLFSPAEFGTDIGKHKKQDIDYESRDTFLVVKALSQYVKKLGAFPLLPLPPGRAFTITKNSVDANEEHEHYRRWLDARGKPPEYSD